MKIRLAEITDDAQLRKLMHETVMPGHINMIYAREPSYFNGARIMCERSQTMVADDNGSIAGVASRSINTLYVDKIRKPIGYLSGLRLKENIRNGSTLARGYSLLKDLHEDKSTNAYLTTIIDGNETATRILTSKRAGLPSYIPMGMYITYVLPVRSDSPTKMQDKDVDIISGDQIAIDEVIDFMNSEGPRRQFFPACDTGGVLRSIGRENILIAMKNKKIVGTMSLWNQEDFKQHIVAGYSSTFNIIRPILNLGLRLKGYRALPQRGAKLYSAVLSLVCIQNDDPYIFNLLLKKGMKNAAKEGLHQLLIGLHERDPLCSIIKKLFHITYKSGLYLVCWEDGLNFYNSIDKNKVPYLELGTL